MGSGALGCAGGRRRVEASVGTGRRKRAAAATPLPHFPGLLRLVDAAGLLRLTASGSGRPPSGMPSSATCSATASSTPKARRGSRSGRQRRSSSPLWQLRRRLRARTGRCAPAAPSSACCSAGSGSAGCARRRGCCFPARPRRRRCSSSVRSVDSTKTQMIEQNNQID